MMIKDMASLFIGLYYAICMLEAWVSHGFKRNVSISVSQVIEFLLWGVKILFSKNMPNFCRHTIFSLEYVQV